MKWLGAALVILLTATGCGSTTASTTATHPAPSEQPISRAKISPACETAHEELSLEEGPHHLEGRAYLAEDKELVQEECGAAARRRWARVKNETPRENECKTARFVLKEAVAEDIPSYIREGEEEVEALCGE